MVMRIVTIAVLAVIAIASLIFLLIKKHLKDVYTHKFVKSDVIKIEETSKSAKDYVFSTTREEKKYINEFILSIRGKKKYFMCEYSKEIKEIIYFLTIYDKNRKLIKVIRIIDVKPDKYSKLVKLPKKARAINIIIHKVNNYEVDQHPVKPLSIFKILSYSLLWGIFAFCLSNAVRLVYLEFTAGYFIEDYLKEYNTLMYIATGVASGVLFITLVLVLLGRNRYFTRNRGEFYGNY